MNEVRRAVRAVAWPFVLTRVLVAVTAILALRAWGVDPVESRVNYGGEARVPAGLEAFVRYDAAWYLAIARAGYVGAIDSGYDMRAGFFPAYPALVAAATSVLGNEVVAALTVSHLAAVGFLVCLWLLVAHDFDERVATRATWAVLLFPSSFFLTGIYSESAMLFAASAGWLAARRGRWGLAAVAAAVAALARPTGIFALLPIVVAAWRGGAADQRRSLTRRAAHAALVALPAGVALAAYAGAMARWFGSPTAAIGAQNLYRTDTGWPWQGFVRWWVEGPAWHGYANSTLDAALALGALGMAIVAWRRWRWEYGLYALVAAAFPISSSLVSFSRLALGVVPAFAAVGLLTERRPVRIALAVLSAALLVVLTARFATWRWVA